MYAMGLLTSKWMILTKFPWTQVKICYPAVMIRNKILYAEILNKLICLLKGETHTF